MTTRKGFEVIADLIIMQFMWGKFEEEDIDTVIARWCEWGHKENTNFNNIVFARRIKNGIKNSQEQNKIKKDQNARKQTRIIRQRVY